MIDVGNDPTANEAADASDFDQPEVNAVLLYFRFQS